MGLSNAHTCTVREAVYATPSQAGYTVYCRCRRCGTTFAVTPNQWQAEVARRAAKAARRVPTLYDDWYFATVGAGVDTSEEQCPAPPTSLNRGDSQ
jgi:hypothetical protein